MFFAMWPWTVCGDAGGKIKALPGRPGMSAFVRIADSSPTSRYVRVVPLPDSCIAAISRWRNRVFQRSGPRTCPSSGNGRPAARIAADIVRIEDGKLAEHWDVPQDEATRAQSVSGLPMFGDRFLD